MKMADSGTGQEGENIEAHRISIFLYGKKPEFLDGKIMRVDSELGFEITEVDGTPVFRGNLDPA